MTAERDTAEAREVQLARELEAAITRRDRAEAAVTAMRATVAEVRQQKRELAQTYRAKLARARESERQTRAELTRLQRSRVYRLTRRAARILHRLIPHH
jgi:predicted mannosyl-3-phosphoglycerate phosphatase (HAD superfamily)